MPKRLIRVTESCILRGVRGNPYGCPLALAVGDALDVKTVCVIGTIHVPFLGQLPMSSRCFDFMVKFDAGREVKPFNFYLEVPNA